jgi:hypothetical protein
MTASFLHIARRHLHSALDKLANSLKRKGVLYVSFKYGDLERLEGERFFNDMNEVLSSEGPRHTAGTRMGAGVDFG